MMKITEMTVKVAIEAIERASGAFASPQAIEEAADLLIQAGCPPYAVFAAADRIHRRNAYAVAERARTCSLSRVGQARRSRCRAACRAAYTS